ncbi:TFIIB-type zinc ribbon-containing protein [Demequina sp.]|uniref:TFIIB-type zinc ribbon-containing protein n=1 Tax=Demequina sp. TaxID=2050685 RepID=UPI003A85B7BD
MTQPAQPGMPSGAQGDGQATPAAASAPDNIIDTSTGRAHGHDDCPQCGSTEVSRKGNTMSLICGFCRYEWVGSRLEDTHGLGEGIGQLAGRTFLTGASDITSADDLITIKCQGCGSEVVIDTARTLKARCHWCRSILSINDKIPNGAVPDGILPFHITKQEAIARIGEFAGNRKFFALKRFRDEFKPENVLGVYMPYMTVDGNISARFHGKGEIQTRRYTVQHGKTSTTYYDADVYDVVRDFDLHVDDLIIESSAGRSNIDNRANTNNIINSLLPYDVKNMVAFDSNYMSEMTAEKRDLNIDDVTRKAHGQFLTMSREAIRNDLIHYDRGVCWTHEELEVHGSRWASVYLPVWLYSYAEKSDNGSVMVHYIAVNGRNGNVMGSVPVNKARLWGVTLLVTLLTAGVSWPIGLGIFAAGL